MEVFMNDGLYCLAEDDRKDREAMSTGECQGETVCQLFPMAWKDSAGS